MRRGMVCLPLLLVFFGGSLPGESALQDPYIPDGEWMVLSVREDENESVMRGTVDIQGEQGELYAVTTSSDREEIRLIMDRGSMATISVRTVRSMAGYRIVSSTEVQGSPALGRDEIRMLDTTGLVYALRGYPFNDPRELRITFLSSDNDDDSNFELSVDLSGKETMTVAGRRIECYRLEMSFEMSGVFSVFTRLVPRTKLWYSVAPPHYMVRYQGQNGPPGTPMTVMEIMNYSGWK